MILITGKGGTAGSWLIRGMQIGQAMGAKVKAMASPEDCSEADLIIVVKRTPAELMKIIKESGKPWIYDMVDCWPQPCEWGHGRAVSWLGKTLADLKPDGVVFGTYRMQRDSGWYQPSLVLPHHSWDKYCSHEPVYRDEVRVIGYEGVPKYLGQWHDKILNACDKRGWGFTVNGDMAQVDIGLSLRDDSSYPGRWWKPGTKLSNLHALGLPAVCTREAGSEHVASGAEIWVESNYQLEEAFDKLASVETRKEIGARMKASQLPIARIAQDYMAWLKQFQ